MKRSELTPIPEYHDRYINLCDDVELLDVIEISIKELDTFPLEKWKKLGDKVYAPGKWTIKDILQHLIDTERIFMYRALAYARNEKTKLPSYEENEYAENAKTSHRTFEELINELRTVHLAFKTMYESFTPEMLARQGEGFKGLYSVASIGFIMAGHQRWHLKVLEERYYSLI
jgi:hypothetical protein